MMSQPLHRFLFGPPLPPPSVFCLHTSAAHHKSPQTFVFLLPRSLYSLFAAQEQFFLKRHQRDGKTCPHTHTRAGVIIMDAHGLSERTRDRERWMFTFLRASASLIGQMNDFIVRLRLAAFPPSRLLFPPSVSDEGG